jgi:rRNA maturation RNase YbeY
METTPYKINIFNESIWGYIPRKNITNALQHILLDAGLSSASINVICLNNNALQQMNKKFLEHDYTTDVISFRLDYMEDTKYIDGEVYLSTEMAESNATEYKVRTTDEICRYAIHGLLHILGYDDNSLEDKEKMRKLEEHYLSIKRTTINY